jgi:streptomycin 6-kinase
VSAIGIPPAFAAGTVYREGEAGQHWLDRLRAVIASLCAEWDLVPDGTPTHDALGLVVQVWRGGEPAVLKVEWVNESTADEAVAFAAWNGEGAVQLLAARPELGALLLERLDGQRSLEDVEPDEAMAVAGHLFRRLAIPGPSAGYGEARRSIATDHRCARERSMR